jgi:hypothetical protein
MRREVHTPGERGCCTEDIDVLLLEQIFGKRPILTQHTGVVNPKPGLEEELKVLIP